MSNYFYGEARNPLTLTHGMCIIRGRLAHGTDTTQRRQTMTKFRFRSREARRCFVNVVVLAADRGVKCLKVNPPSGEWPYTCMFPNVHGCIMQELDRVGTGQSAIYNADWITAEQLVKLNREVQRAMVGEWRRQMEPETIVWAQGMLAGA